MLSRGQKDLTQANCNWPCLVWTNLFIIFLQKMHLVLAHCTALLDDLWVFLLECQEGDESCRLKCNFISSNHLQINIIHWIKWYKWTIQSSNTLLVLVKNQLTEIQKSHEIWTIEYNLFTKYVSHIHAKTFLNSICWSHFQKFLRRTSKMLLHQKEASLGILSAFMYNYKQLNKDKKIYLYWWSSIQHITLGEQPFESLPMLLCCKCFTFLCAFLSIWNKAGMANMAGERGWGGGGAGFKSCS